MRVRVFSTRPYDREFLEAANVSYGHDLEFVEPRLTRETVALADGFPGVCVFVNDILDSYVVNALADGGVEVIALRCAGFNNVDREAARDREIAVVHVPAYSPNAVAEHALALILALNRKIPRAYNRVREGNFSLDGLLGFDLAGKTIGIVGTGAIGTVMARIMAGIGCRVLASDPRENPEVTAVGGEYVEFHELLAESDIVTLHCPLLPSTYHLIDDEALSLMKPGAMLINTSRGAVLDTRAVIDALKSNHLGHVGLDVYEEETGLFFNDLSDRPIQDDVFARLLTFPNVMITGHQAFFTHEALESIADITLSNIADVEEGRPCSNVVPA